MSVVTLVSPRDLSGSSSTAVFSDCGRYRYRLDRVWDVRLPPFVVGMLNPSTADHEVSDPTVTRVRRRAERGGFGSLIVWNAFAFRATDPEEMLAADDPVGPENDRIISEILTECRERRGTAMVGWGVLGNHRDRDLKVIEIAREVGVELYCLGPTKHGHPRHPLYVPSERRLVPWPVPATYREVTLG